ncbi:Rho GTPase-activating protein [Budvicia aquatica]|uniref:Uncharacterized protein n=1 Tax=Budvicia aquatica TaxID=82979 RepID=A0A2C6BVW2_9GAMM|nr:hypothetical protein [Budvicia aquatica]PHI28280.1 hypothetical protein CRN84_02480 [Budvicia aquatica]VFS46168.1 Uncharacterised protein [Budvicia aquatica]
MPNYHEVREEIFSLNRLARHQKKDSLHVYNRFMTKKEYRKLIYTQLFIMCAMDDELIRAKSAELHEAYIDECIPLDYFRCLKENPRGSWFAFLYIFENAIPFQFITCEKNNFNTQCNFIDDNYSLPSHESSDLYIMGDMDNKNPFITIDYNILSIPEGVRDLMDKATRELSKPYQDEKKPFNQNDNLRELIASFEELVNVPMPAEPPILKNESDIKKPPKISISDFEFNFCADIDKYNPNPINDHERLNTVIRYIDSSSVSLEYKIKYVDELYKKWLDQYNDFLRAFEWIDHKDEQQCVYLWEYLKGKGRIAGYLKPYHNAMRCDMMIASIDVWYTPPEEKLEFIQKMKHAWQQSKSNKSKK